MTVSSLKPIPESLKKIVKLQHLIIISTAYRNKQSHIKYQCTKCGYIGEKPYRSLKDGFGCEKCNRVRKKLSYAELKRRFAYHDWELLTKNYTGTFQPLAYKCLKCNQIHHIANTNLRLTSRCPTCSRFEKCPTYDIPKLKRYFEKYGFTLLSKSYKNLQSTLTIQCQYGHKYKTTLNNFQKTTKRCKMCNNTSFGETTIYKLLTANKIPFKYQYHVLDKSGSNHYFDFYLPNQKILIEYDGRQHYEKIDFFKGSFKRYQKRDRIKNEYAKNHQLRMVRVSYKNDTVKKIQKALYQAGIIQSEHVTDDSNIINFKISKSGYSENVIPPEYKEMIEFYKTHTNKQTCEKFNVSKRQVEYWFYNQYHKNKRTYLKQNSNVKIDKRISV